MNKKNEEAKGKVGMKRLIILLLLLVSVTSVTAQVSEFDVSTNNFWVGSTNAIYDLTFISFISAPANRYINITIPSGYEIYIPPIFGYVIANTDVDIWNGTAYVDDFEFNITVWNQSVLNMTGVGAIEILTFPNATSDGLMQWHFDYGDTPGNINLNTTRMVSSFTRGIINNPFSPGQYFWDGEVSHFALGPFVMPGSQDIIIMDFTTTLNFNTTFQNTYFNFTVATSIINNITTTIFTSNNITVITNNNFTSIFNNQFNNNFTLSFYQNQTNIFNNQFNNSFNLLFANNFTNIFTNLVNTNLSIVLYTNLTTIQFNNYNITFVDNSVDNSSFILTNFYNFSIISAPIFNITVITANNNTITIFNNFTEITTNAFAFAFNNSVSNFISNLINVTTFFNSNTTVIAQSNITLTIYNNQTNIFNNAFNFTITSGSVTNFNEFNITLQGTQCSSLPSIPACPSAPSCPALPSIPACPTSVVNVSQSYNFPNPATYAQPVEDEDSDWDIILFILAALVIGYFIKKDLDKTKVEEKKIKDKEETDSVPPLPPRDDMKFHDPYR